MLVRGGPKCGGWSKMYGYTGPVRCYSTYLLFLVLLPYHPQPWMGVVFVAGSGHNLRRLLGDRALVASSRGRASTSRSIDLVNMRRISTSPRKNTMGIIAQAASRIYKPTSPPKPPSRACTEVVVSLLLDFKLHDLQLSTSRTSLHSLDLLSFSVGCLIPTKAQGP